ncbi:MAG TPA: hypothetical protein VF271_03805, partial [Rhodanobacteraceae bacterium]
MATTTCAPRSEPWPTPHVDTRPREAILMEMVFPHHANHLGTLFGGHSSMQAHHPHRRRSFDQRPPRVPQARFVMIAPDIHGSPAGVQ